MLVSGNIKSHIRQEQKHLTSTKQSKQSSKSACAQKSESRFAWSTAISARTCHSIWIRKFTKHIILLQWTHQQSCPTRTKAPEIN